MRYNAVRLLSTREREGKRKENRAGRAEAYLNFFSSTLRVRKSK